MLAQEYDELIKCMMEFADFVSLPGLIDCAFAVRVVCK